MTDRTAHYCFPITALMDGSSAAWGCEPLSADCRPVCDKVLDTFCVSETCCLLTASQKSIKGKISPKKWKFCCHLFTLKSLYVFLSVMIHKHFEKCPSVLFFLSSGYIKVSGCQHSSKDHNRKKSHIDLEHNEGKIMIILGRISLWVNYFIFG